MRLTARGPLLPLRGFDKANSVQLLHNLSHSIRQQLGIDREGQKLMRRRFGNREVT
jgi:hypothetical protein